MDVCNASHLTAMYSSLSINMCFVPFSTTASKARRSFLGGESRCLLEVFIEWSVCLLVFKFFFKR